MKILKPIIQVLLAALIVYLGYVCVKSITDPIEFKTEQTKRYNVTIQRLKDIRTAQAAYKEVNNAYTASFDTLIAFIKTAEFKVIRKEGEIPEDLLGKITEKEAIKKGMIVRDTTRVSIIDSLFPKGWVADSMRFIPYSGGREFTMGVGEVETASKLKVKVFEAKAASKYILKDLDEQEIINLNDGLEYKGLKVGSLTEINNAAGNWE